MAGRAAPAPTLTFRPSARLQRYLGRELISDPNLAVLEFVKNAYDAGASEVLVRFELSTEPTRLIIADDGVGMSFESFERDWMHPGYSAKSAEAPEEAIRAVDSASGKRQASRVPVGEKGLGRLAAGRLGDRLEVFTRAREDDQFLHVYFDWSDFDDMTKAIDEIAIPYEYLSEIPLERELGVGTVVLIENLQLNWAGRVPGRPAVGRSRTRLGRLRQDLELLLRPLDLEAPDFRIDLDSDKVADAADIGPITPSTAALTAGYRYHFVVDSDSKGRVTIKRTLERSSEIAQMFGSAEHEIVSMSGDALDDAGHPETVSCGPFQGVFLYNPPPARERAKKDDVVGHGVLLYRDDVLVEPYGLDGNDWVGVGARKAQRQGHALIQPATFWGEIHITREDNEGLRDMANRQGLLESEPALEFFAHVRAEFRFFEDLVGSELERRWKQPDERRSEQAVDRLQLAVLRAKNLAHSLRQPLMAIGGEVVTMGHLLDDETIPPGSRAPLLAVRDRIASQVQRAEHLVQRYAEAPVPSFREVGLAELVEAAVADVRLLAEDHGIQVGVDLIADERLVAPVALIQESFAELLRNAIEAPRPSKSAAVVRIAANVEGKEIVVTVEDNGAGLDGVHSGSPLGEVDLATKARPPGGLVQVEETMALVRGRAVIASTGPDGTSIELRIPRER